MAFTKITNAELNSRGATTLPNVPTIGATALKQEFDAPAKNIVAPKVNNLIDELQASTAAGDLGAVAPTGRTGTSVQSVLNSISSDLGTAEAQSHAHPNKAVIDKFDDTGTGLTYDGNPVGAVTSVNGQTGAVSLTASDVGALPSSTSIPSKTSDLTNDSNFVADASYVHTDNNYDATAKAIVDGATAAIASKSTVAWNQIDTTGTKIAEITIDGVKTDVKATGGGNADAYKTIESGGQSFVASGADTFKINAGSNVTITPLTGDKGIQISAAGGGTSTGDMLMNDYDRTGDVKSASSTGNGIKDYVAGAISGKADTSSLATVATSGAYADLTGQPTIPTITDTYSATSSNGMSGKAVASAISGKADTADVPTELNDLTDVTITGTPSQGETLIADANGVFKNQPMPQGGHTMLPTPSASLTEAQVVKAIDAATGANENVPSLFGIRQWTNEKKVRRVMTGTTPIGNASIGSTGIGAWTDKDPSDITTADEADWWQDNAFIIPNNSDDIDLTLKFDPSSGEPVTLGGYILDTTTGKLCIKFGNSIATPANAKIAVDITYTRNEVS